VAPGRQVEFHDAIHGDQRFASDDIGDFVVRRADGSVAFFLGNAIDDALMGVSLVLRGDDHLANTPRQLLILEALGLPRPAYGHLPLLLDPAGSPLSKREGAASLHDLREQGYLPGALCNYLVRLGHACSETGWLDGPGMARSFRLDGTSRSAARFDEAQLRHWQREAITHATLEELLGWLGTRLASLDDARRRDFVAAVRGNLLFPDDVIPLVGIVTGEQLAHSVESTAELHAAGSEFFSTAAGLLDTSAMDFRAWAKAVGGATGRKGAALYMPLRAALTGGTHGPELAPLFGLMGPQLVRRRLEDAEERSRVAC
jgi:glutamyl-tRNA synthetase